MTSVNFLESLEIVSVLRGPVTLNKGGAMHQLLVKRYLLNKTQKGFHKLENKKGRVLALGLEVNEEPLAAISPGNLPNPSVHKYPKFFPWKNL